MHFDAISFYDKGIELLGALLQVPQYGRSCSLQNIHQIVIFNIHNFFPLDPTLEQFLNMHCIFKTNFLHTQIFYKCGIPNGLQITKLQLMN